MTADNNTMKSLVLMVLVMAVSLGSASAAQREAGGSAKIVGKLQAMVKEITTERDLLKTENAKVTAELETLKGQVKQEKDAATAAATAATAAQAKLTADLTSQKAAADEVHGRLDNTMAKLREVIEKYNALNKSKNDLAVTLANLQNTQQATSAELKSCESKNLKMFEGAKTVIEGFQSCQQRGIVDTLVNTEPFSQIKDVEFETVMQDYEDKLRKQKYQSKTVPVAPVVTTETTGQAPSSAPKTPAPVSAPSSVPPANPAKK